MGLFSELRRRNVYRMAVLYVVAAWLIMQVTEVIMALTELPRGTGEVVLVLLAIGFPIALVFSWFYELTPEGLSLDKDVEPSDSIAHVTGRRMDFVVIALLCAAVIVFAYDKWWMSGPPITSVAVLPLENLSSDPEQVYFADGMTGVLTSQLAQIESLRVISRTSAMRYKTTDMSLPEIARKLGVDAIVEGSVQPHDEEVRFTLQLIDGRTDRHLWSQSYVRDLRNVLTLQGEVARAIADEIQITLTPRSEARLARDRSVEPDALRLWVVGYHHLEGNTEDSFDKALLAFQEAIRRDSEFADAHAGLAHAYLGLAGWHASNAVDELLPLARAAAEKAIYLDPDLANSHFALARSYYQEWKWESAEREFRRGIALDPSNYSGPMEYANFLGAMGRFDEAVKVATLALELDPLSPAAHNELGGSLWMAGQEDAAFGYYYEALDLDPEFFQTHWILASSHILANDHAKAQAHIDKLSEDIETLPLVTIGQLGRFCGIVGHRDKAQNILTRLLQRAETEFVPASALVYAYLGLKDHDAALTWLETAYDQREMILVWLEHDPDLAELHNEPRFQDLVARMGFPDVTQTSPDQKL